MPITLTKKCRLSTGLGVSSSTCARWAMSNERRVDFTSRLLSTYRIERNAAMVRRKQGAALRFQRNEEDRPTRQSRRHPAHNLGHHDGFTIDRVPSGTNLFHCKSGDRTLR